jgi:chromosome segregation ATPase
VINLAKQAELLITREESLNQRERTLNSQSDQLSNAMEHLSKDRSEIESKASEIASKEEALVQERADFNRQESRFIESSTKSDNRIRLREAELKRLEESLNEREKCLNDRAESVTSQILAEEKRLSDLTDMCQASSRQVLSLNEEANGIRASINSNLVDLHAQLNRVSRDVEAKENDLKDVTLDLKNKSNGIEEMKRQKAILTNEVRDPGQTIYGSNDPNYNAILTCLFYLHI